MRFAKMIKRKPEWTDAAYIAALERELAIASITVPDSMLGDSEGCGGCRHSSHEDWPRYWKCAECPIWKEEDR